MVLASQINWFRFFFITEDNKFNWIVATTIIAALTLIWNIWFSRRKYTAELISKSRIEWINSTKPIVSRYIEEFTRYRYLYNVFATTKSGSDEHKNSFTSMNVVMQDFKKDYYLIRMSIPDNKSNQSILKYIKLMWNEIDMITPFYNYANKTGKLATTLGQTQSNFEKYVSKYLDNLTNDTVDAASTYFKNEWERAKKGK